MPPVSCRTTVYPRVCGGTRSTQSATEKDTGLSPRVRGNRLGCPHQPMDIGSIPACAGEPCAVRECQRNHGVYPRVCGGTSAWCPAG